MPAADDCERLLLAEEDSREYMTFYYRWRSELVKDIKWVITFKINHNFSK